VACIGETRVDAPLPGCLRGITHDGATVGKTKIMGERPRRIAEGVLKTMKEIPAPTGTPPGAAAS
jgi:hypothetical protein